MTEHLSPIPDGITLGNKVLLVPALDFLFSHSGSISYRPVCQSYSWINRGDSICKYFIRTPKSNIPIIKLFAGENTESAIIRSPVSGFILHKTYNYGPEEYDRNNDSYMVRFSILLPDDEPKPENGSFIFQDACQLASKHKEYFLKPSRYWSMKGVSAKKFEDTLEQQKAFNCLIVDALPRYQDYLDDARINHPSLRPYIKHLQH